MSFTEERAALNNEQKKHSADMQPTYSNEEEGGYKEIEGSQKSTKSFCQEEGINHTINAVESLEVSKEKEELEKSRRHVRNSKYEKHLEKRKSEHDITTDTFSEKVISGYPHKSVDMYKKNYNNISNSNMNNTSNLKRGPREGKRNDASNFSKNAYANDSDIMIDKKEKLSDINTFSKKDMPPPKKKMENPNNANLVNLESDSNMSNNFGRTGFTQEANNCKNNNSINNTNGKGYKTPIPVNYNANLNVNCEPTVNTNNENLVEPVNNMPIYNNMNPNYNYAQGYSNNNINNNANCNNNSYNSNNNYNSSTNFSNNTTYINNSSSNNVNSSTNNNNTNSNANNNNTNSSGSGKNISSYNATSNYYLYSCCAEENDKNCEYHAYYTPQMYNTFYNDSMSGASVTVGAAAATSTAAASTVACAPGGQYNYRYAYVMNDYCNYYPYNGNYYYYNTNNPYYNMSLHCGNMNNVNGNEVNVMNSNIPCLDPSKVKKEKNTIQDKNSNNVKIKDNLNIYDELKSRVIDIFKRENMMTDDYLLYYVYNNVKLNLDIIAKHPYISSIIGNNMNVLQDVLNDLKHYDMVTAESGENTSNRFSDRTLDIIGNDTEKQKQGNDTCTNKSCSTFIAKEEKVDMKKNERKKDTNNVDANENEKREDGNIIMDGIYHVENELPKGTEDKKNRLKVTQSVEEMIPDVKQETNNVVEVNKDSNEALKSLGSNIKEKEKNADNAIAKQPEEINMKNDVRATEEDNRDFLLNLNNKRNTIIIRDIYAYYIDKIKELVYSCPHIKKEEIMDIKNECNNTIFITLKNAKKTESLAQYLKEQTVDNSKLNVRIKSIQKIQSIIENNIIKKTISANNFGSTPNINTANSRTFTNSVCGGNVVDGCAPFEIEEKSLPNKTSQVAFLSKHVEVAVPNVSNETNGFDVENATKCLAEKNNESTSNVTTAIATTVNVNTNGSNRGNVQEIGNKTNVGFLKTGCENITYEGMPIPNINPIPAVGMRTTNEMNNYYIMPNSMVVGYDNNACANNNTGNNNNVTGTGFDPMLNYYHYAYNNLTYGCNMYSSMNSCGTCSNSMFNNNNNNTVLSANFSTNGETGKKRSDFEKGAQYVRGDEAKILNNEQFNLRNHYTNAYNNNGYVNNYGNLYAMNYVNAGMYPYNYAQGYYQYNVHNMYGNNFKGIYNGIYNGGYGGTYNIHNSNSNNINNNINNSTNNNSISNNNTNNNNISNNSKIGGDNKEHMKCDVFSEENKKVNTDMPNEKHLHSSTHLRKNGKRETKGVDSNGTNVVVMPSTGANEMGNGNQNTTTATGSTTSNSASRFSQRYGKSVTTNSNNANGNFSKGGKMKYYKKEIGNFDNFLGRNNMNTYDNKWNNYFSNRRGGRFDYERKGEVGENVDGTSDVNVGNNGNKESGSMKDGFNFDNPDIARIKRENSKKEVGGKLNNADVESTQENNEKKEEHGDEDGKRQSKYSSQREHEHEKDNEKMRLFKGDKNKNRKEVYPNDSNINNNNAMSSSSNNNRRNDYYYYTYHNEKKDYFKNMITYNNSGYYNSGNSYNANSNNINTASRKPFKFYQNKDKYNILYEDKKGYRGKNNFDGIVENNNSNNNNNGSTNNYNNNNGANNNANNFSNKGNGVTNESEKNDATRNDITSNVSESFDLNKNDSTCSAYMSVNSKNVAYVKKMNDTSKNTTKYSFVDIVDSCKKIKDVNPPECIDNLMKENVSLFRKRDDQFCWKLNVC